jgi:hypothetical protein
MRKEFDGISRSFFVWDMIDMQAKALASCDPFTN